MDLPPFQHRRYVSFSDTSNFYRSQPNRLPAPPPPQPPPPTIPSLPPPPLLPPAHHPSLPPPSVHPPSQPQFSFRPNPSIEERALQLSNFVPAHHLNQLRPLPRLPSPPRVSLFHHNNRSQSRFDDNSRFSDPWSELPLLSRVPPEPPLNHNNRPEVFSPLSPYTGNYRNNFQSSLRFKEEYMGGGFRDDVYPQLPLWGRKETRLEARDDVVDHEYSYGAARERYEWNSGRGNRDFVSADFSLNPSRVFDIDLRSHYSSMENERKHGHNSAHLRGERPELYKDSGFEDLSRSNCNRGGERRADSYFNSSPRKKHLHKRSVLQRIQLGKGNNNNNNNNRNRRHDHNHLPESYHDESNSVGGGNFKGKEIDINARLERKIEEERENSPMELDVLFKSNALIAKAVKATPSPNIELNRDLVSRNSKIRKINLSDSPGTGLNENLEGTESSIDFLDKDLREFGNNVLADKTDRSVLESQYSELSNECQKSSENVTADSSILYLDIPSDSDKDLGKFTNKIKATFKGSLSSSGGSEPCSGSPVGSAANKESPKSVEYDQVVKGVESDGKRKRITSPLQTKGEGHEQTSFECLSADTPSEAILLDEGLSNSDGLRIMSAVASDFRTDLVVDEKVKSSPVGDLKKHDIVVNSTKLPLHQSSAMVSVPENYWDAYVCEDGLNSDNRVEHSFQEGPVLFKSSPDAKVMDSVEVNAAKGNKFHDTQMEECRPLSSEQRLGRVSKKIDVAPSMNVNSEVSLPNQEDYTIVEGSPNPISCVSPSKIESVPRENTASFNSNDHFQHGCVDMDSQGVKIDSVGLNRKASTGDEFCEINLPCMEDFASSSNSISLNVDSSRVFSTNSADRLVHGDSGDAPSDLVLDMQNSKSSQSDELSNRCSGKQKIFTKNPISGVDSVIPSSLSSKIDIKLGQGSTSIVNSQKMLLRNSNSLPDKSTLSNNCPNTSMHGGLPCRASVKYPTAGKAPSFNLVSRSRTWHRTGSPSQSVAGPEDHVTSQINLQEETGKGQNAYVRKGNSLVRKRTAVTIPQRLRASSPSMYHSNPGMDNLKKIRRSENDVNISESSTLATTVECVVGPERPKTPPLIGTVKLNCIHADHEDSACPQTDPLRKNCPGEKLDPSYSVESTPMRKSMEEGLSSGIKEHEDVSRSNVNCQGPDERNSGKKITYVKRKSNQLVAFSNSSDPSFKSPENPQPLTSDAYYKRRNNQLIRTSVEDNPKQQSVIPCKILSSQRQEIPKNTQNRHSCKRQTGFTKKKFSLVWTLHETLSSKKDADSRPFRTVRPFLFPWRRATYWTSFKHSSSSSSNDNLASGINRKLLLSRKNDTIYKKSFSGFSLRRSKVLSFCGRSLKWSKSMDRNSRKANEDALQAVVAAEKKKGEQNGKRIFRIGSERYRMDPTRKTLQRISDEKLPYSEDQSRNKAKKFFVPTRLLIGNDEYVRIGNGNQLVRDPKKRTRTLANEKVRWSLHTARMRLARKKKFCQFFTRFGKCNKDDKRCPYIHDPSKIAVCTKFLNGCCFDSNCKLTHEVIPERMQDCSYFLQGFCSNESCPYRHVNVNPKSPVCEGFLRGYCADGNECRKKHTYVCPAFEATGNCQQGVTCKLHHPKTKKKGAKSKALLVQKNARGGGRYFGVPASDIAANSAKTVPKFITGECDDQVFCQDGKFKDFIRLGDSDDDDAIEEPRIELMSCDSDKEEEPLDMEVDFDELIKPIRLMKPLGNVVFLDSPPTIDITGGSSVSGSPLQMR